MIPTYIYVPAMLAMLGLHLLTVWLSKRKIDTLQAALVARRVLLGVAEGSFHKRQWLNSGEMMMLEDSQHNILEIKVSHGTEIDVKVYDR